MPAEVVVVIVIYNVVNLRYDSFQIRRESDLSELLSMSAEQLLSSPFLFRPSSNLKEEQLKLLKKWHPDRNSHPRASEVVARVNEHYDRATTGDFPGFLKIKTSKADVHLVIIGTSAFELGDFFITPQDFVWRVRPAFKDLAKQFLDVTKTLKYPNDDVRAKIAPFVPQNVRVVVNTDWTYVLVKREYDHVRLADLRAKLGPMDERHVAWCLSRAYNLAGLLQYNKLTHLDISPSSLLVEPSSHRGALLGGWFYAGAPKPIAAPARTAHLAKQEPSLAHGQQIKLLGRELIGARTVPELRAMKIKEPLKSWLIAPSSGDVVRDHTTWQQVLTDAFGERRFTELKVSTADVYG